MKGIVAILLVCAVTLTLATIVAMMRTRLPIPTGPWIVGTTVVTFDGTRPPITARLWYPAARGARGARAPYHYAAHGISLRDRIVYAFVRTDALVGVPMRDGRLPVLIYVPGFGGRSFHNSARAQELASHGYLVVALDDTQRSPDFDFTSASGVRRSIAAGDRKVRSQARDVVRVIDELHDRDRAPSGSLSHRLALDRIGVFGFSFGGAVAAEVAATDDRVRAAVDLDGSIFGTVALTGVPKPFLFATAVTEIEDPFEADFDRKNFALLERGLKTHGGYVLKVDGADHLNFSDAGILPSLRHTGVGAIDGRRGESIVSRYVLAFFDRHLRGRPEAVLDGNRTVDAAATLRTYAR